jgi:hypothetical protein
MTSRDFCYWLQGYFELRSTNIENDKQSLTVPQVDMIRNHLNLVFKHEIDPSMPDPTGVMLNIHDGGQPFKPSDGLANWPFPTTYRC